MFHYWLCLCIYKSPRNIKSLFCLNLLLFFSVSANIRKFCIFNISYSYFILLKFTIKNTVSTYVYCLVSLLQIENIWKFRNIKHMADGLQQI